MKRALIIAAALACLLVIAPVAAAGEGATTQASPTAAPTDTTASTTSTTSGTTTSTGTSATTTTTPPEATTTTTTTATPPTSTTTTTTVPGIGTAAGTGTDLPELPADDPCIASVAACDNLPVAGEGVGPSPVYGAGRSLPYTGIEDALLPMLIGLVALLGGVIAYRYATVRERLSRVLRRVEDRAAFRPATGYTHALHNIESDARTAAFWSGQRISAA